uniref:Legume lectin domain-containing protein n=1 Tax=Salix viminalis TaxID=40686 RepID=A0A6N2MZE6_SALVM
MGRNRSGHAITSVIFPLLLMLFSPVHGLTSYDPESLDDLIHRYAMNAQAKKRTGTSLKVSLPANFSGMEVSVVRLRSGHFWDRGVNVSSFYIPPRVHPFPFVKRLSIVYQNLGNWSTRYYKVPDYSLVAPVVGLMAYDASNLSSLGSEALKFSVQGDPILISFPDLGIRGKLETLKCVKLGPDGFVQFRNITRENTCITQGDGHFSLAVQNPEVEKNRRVWKWYVAGFGAGFLALVLLGVIGYTTFKLARSKKLRKMEAESENGVALDATSIGRSKMPSASMVRTQPALEQDCAP